MRKKLLPRAGVFAAILLCFFAAEMKPGGFPPADVAPSQAAADSCDLKVKSLESFGSQTGKRKKQTTRFSEEEINSYLALRLSSKYHPSLKSLSFKFENGAMQSGAVIDFDSLSMNSTKMFTKLVAKMFSGIHKLQVRGKLVTEAGKGSFQLSEARFDDNALPNFLVEQIISAVGRKQKPPFDPIQPSPLPYSIEKVDVLQGYIVVYQ